MVAVVDCVGNDVDVYTKQFLDKSNNPLLVLKEKVDSGTIDAEPIVRKLLSIKRRFNSVSPLKKAGIVPLIELADNSSLLNDVREPKELGMEPVSLLSPIVICSTIDRAPKLEGMEPTSEFFSR